MTSQRAMTDVGRGSLRATEWIALKEDIRRLLPERRPPGGTPSDLETKRRQIRTDIMAILSENRRILRLDQHERLIQEITDDITGFGPLQPLL